MVSSSSDQADNPPGSPTSLVPATSKPDWTAQVDREQIFRLIDSILPFEACLYHQILPLSLEGSRLKLGMVNLDDSAALDYVRRILAYMNCSLVPQTLASSIHHAALSAYLNYTGNQKQAAHSQSKSQIHTLPKHSDKKPAQATPPPSADSTPLPTQEANQAKKHDPHSSPTFLLDSPEYLNFQDLEIATPLTPPPAILSVPSAPEAESATPQHTEQEQQATFILRSDTLSSVPIPLETPPERPDSGDALPTLDIDAKHLSDSPEVLTTLPPDQLLQELLGRVLLGGIGRLYLERQSDHGRILWSQNGVLQSVLEEIPVETLQGVISELKILTRLPMIPVQKPKQVEIERLYQRHRLLLRLRVMPGTHGEEATVQVLRGAALKFYQQQQLANLSRDALGIAQELQHKVNEMRVRTRFYPMLTVDQLSILPALDTVLKSVEQQLEALKTMQLAETQPKPEEEQDS